MPRYALAVEYDGTEYDGWQSQAVGMTLQQSLQKALSVVANSAIVVNCAGRTDAGVHASGQVVHFDSPVERSARAWMPPPLPPKVKLGRIIVGYPTRA